MVVSVRVRQRRLRGGAGEEPQNHHAKGHDHRYHRRYVLPVLTHTHSLSLSLTHTHTLSHTHTHKHTHTHTHTHTHKHTHTHTHKAPCLGGTDHVFSCRAPRPSWYRSFYFVCLFFFRQAPCPSWYRSCTAPSSRPTSISGRPATSPSPGLGFRV